jgi:hypothetical protein
MSPEVAIARQMVSGDSAALGIEDPAIRQHGHLLLLRDLRSQVLDHRHKLVVTQLCDDGFDLNVPRLQTKRRACRTRSGLS